MAEERASGGTIATDIERDRLPAFQKMEEAEHLAAGLVHDLNNYLAAIRGHAELVLGRSGAESPNARNIRAVMRLVERSANLVSRLRVFTRGCSVRPQVVDLNSVIAELTEMVLPVLGARVRLETHLESGLWLVKVDRAWIEQAVLNLLINAREALSDRGCITIRSCNLPGDGGDDHVRLSVSDTGSGISNEVLDHLFEPFVTTKRHPGSSGLGLSIVHDVVSSAGGAVEVDSRPDAGTTFHLILPRSDTPSEASDAITEDAVTGGAERVLPAGGSATHDRAVRGMSSTQS